MNSICIVSGELIVSRYVAESITTDCRTFRPRRPLSTAYKTVLYAVDKGLRGRNVLQSVAIDSATYLLTISSPDIDNVAMSLYDIICIVGMNPRQVLCPITIHPLSVHVQPSVGALLLSKDSELASTSQPQKIGHPDKVYDCIVCIIEWGAWMNVKLLNIKTFVPRGERTLITTYSMYIFCPRSARYQANWITTDAGRFGHVGLCHTKLKILQCETSYIANTDQWCYVIVCGFVIG